MTDEALPADDPDRQLTLAKSDSAEVQHVALAGDVYTILVTGAQTAGRYCLIDMRVLDGGGPGPHRHDFEEMFTLLEGELEITFRSETRTVKAPATVNVPANAPHSFKNSSGRTVRMLCMCTPAGQDDFFLAIGTPVDDPDQPPPPPSAAQQDAGMRRARQLAPQYRTKMLG